MAPGGHLAVPVDSVKPKAEGLLGRERNLAADPRATLLVQHWERQDWSALWWVRAELRRVPDPAEAVVADLTGRLSRASPQYSGRPFTRLLVFDIVATTGWSAT